MDIPIEMAKGILLPDLSLTDLFRVGVGSTLIIGSILYVTDILHIRFRLLYRLLQIMDCFLNLHRRAFTVVIFQLIL